MTTLTRTSTAAPAPPRPVRRSRLQYAVADGWTMTRRYLAHIVRAPEEIVIYFTLPIMMVLVFGYVFGSGMGSPAAATTGSSCCPGCS